MGVEMHIHVLIPSYKRPNELLRLLRAIEQLDLKPRKVTVADNDAERAEAKAVCQSLAPEFAFPLRCILVHERGISAARNALFNEAANEADCDFAALIDDDEIPDTAWLKELIQVQASTDADIVGGAVAPIFDGSPPEHIAEHEILRSQPMKSGPIEMVVRTGNTLIRTNFIRDFAEQWFDPAFGLTGGEDFDFMLRAKLKGAKFAYSNESVIYHFITVDRTTSKWLLMRLFRIGGTELASNMKNRPPGWSSSLTLVRTFLGLGKGCLLFLVSTNKASRMKWKGRIAYHCGRLAAFCGRLHKAYA